MRGGMKFGAGLPAAVRQYLEARAGTVTDASTWRTKRRLRWEVKPDDGAQVHEVQIDAFTGRIISDHLDD